MVRKVVFSSQDQVLYLVDEYASAASISTTELLRLLQLHVWEVR